MNSVERGFDSSLGYYLDEYEEVITENDLLDNGYYVCPNCPRRLLFIIQNCVQSFITTDFAVWFQIKRQTLHDSILFFLCFNFADMPAGIPWKDTYCMTMAIQNMNAKSVAWNSVIISHLRNMLFCITEDENEFPIFYVFELFLFSFYYRISSIQFDASFACKLKSMLRLINFYFTL